MRLTCEKQILTLLQDSRARSVDELVAEVSAGAGTVRHTATALLKSGALVPAGTRGEYPHRVRLLGLPRPQASPARTGINPFEWRTYDFCGWVPNDAPSYRARAY